MTTGSLRTEDPHGPAVDGAPEGDDVGSTIQSVERAARILGFFTVGRPRLTLSEITARLGVSKATAHRYAMALRRVNLLRYDGTKYTLGPQVLTLASAARAGLPIIRLAGPIMEKLVSEVNETVVLSVWEGDAPIVVRVDDGTERLIRVSVRAGARLSPFDSAQGRVFCAFLPEGEVPGLTEEMARSTRLDSELKAVRQAGVAVNAPEFHGVRTLAAPVFSDGQIIAVVAVVGTTATVPDDISSSVAKALQKTAEEITAIYGRHEVQDTSSASSRAARALSR